MEEQGTPHYTVLYGIPRIPTPPLPDPNDLYGNHPLAEKKRKLLQEQEARDDAAEWRAAKQKQ